MSKFAVESKIFIDAWLSLVERCVRDVKVQVKISYFRRVAQLGRALRSGRQGASKNFIFSACGSAW